MVHYYGDCIDYMSKCIGGKDDIRNYCANLVQETGSGDAVHTRLVAESIQAISKSAFGRWLVRGHSVYETFMHAICELTSGMKKECSTLFQDRITSEHEILYWLGIIVAVSIVLWLIRSQLSENDD